MGVDDRIPVLERRFHLVSNLAHDSLAARVLVGCEPDVGREVLRLRVVELHVPHDGLVLAELAGPTVLSGAEQELPDGIAPGLVHHPGFDFVHHREREVAFEPEQPAVALRVATRANTLARSANGQPERRVRHLHHGFERLALLNPAPLFELPVAEKSGNE